MCIHAYIFRLILVSEIVWQLGTKPAIVLKTKFKICTYICMYVYTVHMYSDMYVFVHVHTYIRTVKPVYKDHSRDQVIMVFVDRWSLCRDVIVLL